MWIALPPSSKGVIPIIRVLNTLMLLTGVFCLYTAIFVYENEDKEIQNKLEDMWIKINDRRNSLLSRHTVFMRVVALYLTAILNRIFGSKIISIRAVGVSACLSTISFCLIGIANWIYIYSLIEGISFQGLIVLCLMIVLCCIFIGLAGLLKRKVDLIVWLIYTFFFGVLANIGLYLTLFGTDFYRFILHDTLVLKYLQSSLYLLLSIVIGVSCDVVFLTTTRLVLRWSLGLSSFFQIATVIFVNAFLCFTLFLGPYFFLVPDGFGYAWMIDISHLEDSFSANTIKAIVVIAAQTNLFVCIIALLFFFLAFMMLVHRLSWPLLERPIYSLQAIGIIRRKKMLAATGILLIGGGLGYLPEWLKVFKDWSG
jgi:hypothetical protein